MTCTEIGESLWPNMKGNRQSMCRPAGKLVKRAIAAGLVREKLEIGKKHLRRRFYQTSSPALPPTVSSGEGSSD